MGKDKWLKYYLVAGDIFLLYFALFFTLVIRTGNLDIIAYENIGAFLYHFSILYVFCILFLFALDFYEISYFKKVSKFFSNLFFFSLAYLFLGMAYFYLRPELTFTPKTILLLNIILFNLLFFLWRYSFSRIIVKQFKEKIIIIGLPRQIDKIFGHMVGNGYDIAGFFVTRSLFDNSDGYAAPPASGAKILLNMYELKEMIRKEKIKLIIFTDDFYENKELAKRIFAQLPLQITFLSFHEFYESLVKKISLDMVNEMWFLEEISRAESRIYYLEKRLFDIMLSLLFFALTALLFPFIAIAIMADSRGSIFYHQKRVGKNGKVFTVWKFRSMKEADKEDKTIWREKNEGQITRTGAFLRRFHLDELPQCWSILRGDLSFVGPRPEWVQIAKIFEKEIPFYHQRYLITPGFTGWAQINFPPSNSVAEAKEKFEYDLYYIKNRSIFLDIEIILKTVRLILT